MDQQSQNPTPEKHVPTEAEIARLEAEAAAALSRGEAIPRSQELPETPAEAAAAADAQNGPQAPRPDFVPYVDDVPDPQPAASNDAEDGDDDDDTYIPSEMEKRIDAMTPEQWKRWQILGGVGVGIAIVVCLFAFGQELATYGLIVAALLAIILPRYLERAWRRKLNTARMAMIITMVIGLAVMFVVTGMRNGFSLRGQ
jgi:hypothetical protein